AGDSGDSAGDSGVVSNRPPTVTDVQISPSTAFNDTKLTCSATVGDPDGTTPSVTYGWKNTSGGDDLGTAATLQLTPAIASPFDEVVCTVMASDGTASASDSGQIEVANRAPQVTSTTIDELTALNDQAWSCSAQATDPDGDEVELSYEWRNSSRDDLFLGEGATLPMSSAIALPGELITCTAQAFDGSLGSSTASSSAIATQVVENRRPPNPSGLEISPEDPDTLDTLTCRVLFPPEDEDGEVVTMSYAWATTAGASPAKSVDGATLGAWRTAPGETWRCTATATDAGGATSSASLSVTPTEARPQAGDVLEDPWLGSLTYLPSGTFTQGCLVGRDDVGGLTCNGTNATPPHEVTLTHGTWVGTSEVTQAQWKARTGNRASSKDCPSCCTEPATFYEALAFANAVSQAAGEPDCFSLVGCTGTMGSTLHCDDATVTAGGGDPQACAGYRVPTEAEWTYAARAGELVAYAGSNVVAEVAWTSDTTAPVTTQPVCTKEPNAWGLCDMSGNVGEWAFDRYAAIEPSITTQIDPFGAASGATRLVLGGAARSPNAAARVAQRSGSDPNLADDRNGFRIARTATPPTVNTPPQMDPPVVGEDPSTGDLFCGNGEVTDADGDPITVRLVWFRNDTPTRYQVRDTHDGAWSADTDNVVPSFAAIVPQVETFLAANWTCVASATDGFSPPVLFSAPFWMDTAEPP
ncbi:MAG: SUMF1/EgtB/PvdO family nonheme iron enzyme, partial [Alphaproteobacteria bacterium]|nr:SUMF1/EgtB/PvdO family nonheme iron enzyme [Alphaproteobacteria bacterium]